jgi:hypothetical protein
MCLSQRIQYFGGQYLNTIEKKYLAKEGIYARRNFIIYATLEIKQR